MFNICMSRKGDVERWKPMFEKLYDEHESVKVRFLGFMTHDTRYDFGIVYTNMFFESHSLFVCKREGLLYWDKMM